MSCNNTSYKTPPSSSTNPLQTVLPITNSTKVVVPLRDSIRQTDAFSAPTTSPLINPTSISAHPDRYAATAAVTVPINNDSTTLVRSAPYAVITRPLPLDSLQVTARHRPATPAQPPRFRDDTMFDIRYLDIDQGLNGSYQMAICQTQAGYLWFGATPGGISRYDGKYFLQFTAKEGLIHDEINDLLEDRRGNLWIATPQGLSKYDGFTFTNFTLGIDLNVLSILEDSAGNLWLTTSQHGVLQYNGTDFTQLAFADNCFTENFGNLTEINGTLWLASDCGLLACKDGVFTRYEATGWDDGYINGIAAGADNQLWITTSNGFSQFDGITFTHFELPPAYQNVTLLNILEDQRGQVWLGTEDSGLIKYDGEYFISYTTQNGLSSNEITDLVEGDYGQLWVGTYGAGINKLNTLGSFEHLLNVLEVDDVITNYIHEDRSQNLWLPTQYNGLLKYDGKRVKQFLTHHGLLHNETNYCIEDRNGHLWISYGTGVGIGVGEVSHFNGQTFTHYTEAQGLTAGSVVSMLEDRTGQLWVATTTGLSRFDGTSFTAFYPVDENVLGSINHIVADQNGGIWVGTTRGLAKFDGSSFVLHSTNDGLIDNSIDYFVQDSRGVLMALYTEWIRRVRWNTILSFF